MALVDTLAGAAIPLGVGFGVWVARQFIRQEVNVERGPKGERGERGQDSRDLPEYRELLGEVRSCQDVIKKLSERPFIDMSVRDCEQLLGIIEKRFNGRYMFAEEARDRFVKVHQRIDVLSNCITQKIDDLRDELANRFTKG
jgi:hypothetical protein